MKKGLIILAVLLVALSAGLLLTVQKDLPFFFRESPIHKAIPGNIPVFIEVKSIGAVPAGNKITQALKKIGPAFLLTKQATAFDSLFFASAGKSSLNGQPLVIALKFEGKNELTPLLIWKAGSRSGKAEVSEFLYRKFPASSYRYEQRMYDKFTVTDIYDAKGDPRFSWALEEGLLMACTKSVLVDQALRQLSSEGLPQDPGFVQVSKTSKAPADISVYINHRYFPEFFGKWLNQATVTTRDEFGETVTTRYSRDISAFARFGEWSKLDIQLSDDFIKMKGLTIASDSLYPWLQVFKGQQPRVIQADKILPVNTSFFVSYSLSDNKDFFSRLDDYFRIHKMNLERESSFNQMQMKARTDLKKLFREMAGTEIILAITQDSSDVGKKSALFIFPTKNKAIAKDQLIQMFQKYADKNGKTLDDLTTVVDKEKKIIAYRFPFPSIAGIWLGRPFHTIKVNYLAFRDQYVIMASDEAGLKEYFTRAEAEETLSKSIAYQHFIQQTERQTTINIYFDLAKGFDLCNEYLNQSVVTKLMKKKELLENFRFFNWQITNAKGACFNNLKVCYSEEIARVSEEVITGAK